MAVEKCRYGSRHLNCGAIRKSPLQRRSSKKSGRSIRLVNSFNVKNMSAELCAAQQLFGASLGCNVLSHVEFLGELAFWLRNA